MKGEGVSNRYRSTSLAEDLLFVGITVGGGLLGGTASSNATWATLAIRRVDGKVDVLLGVGADQERRNVHQLLANADVTLTNEDASVMDRLGQVELENLGLEASLHEDLRGELQDIIKRVLFVSEDTVSLQAADQRGSLEKALGVLSVQSQQSSGSLQYRENDHKAKIREHQAENDNHRFSYLADLGKHVLNAPNLALAAKTIFTAKLELLVQTFLLERTADSAVCLSVCKRRITTPMC